MTERDILLVEDDPADVGLISRALRLAGRPLRLHHVRDGVECLAFLRREGPWADAPRPDLVLLDLNMPLMDGREALAEIRRDPSIAAVPVVILTTSEHSRDVGACHALGVNGFVVKPMDLDEFTELMRSIADHWLGTAPPDAR
ncbi:MAG: response regulator [Alphaproteobacteria bacterium]|nr:response regulator [Alphaproteobacteria bacterium]